MPKKKQLTLMTRRRHKRGQVDLCLYLYLDPILDPDLYLDTILYPFQHKEKVGNLALLLKRQGLEKKISPLFWFLWWWKSSNGFCKSFQVP